MEAIVKGGDPDNAELQELADAIEAECPGCLEEGDEDSALELLQAVFGDDENLEGDPSDPLLEDNVEARDPVEASFKFVSFGTDPFGQVQGMPDPNSAAPRPAQGKCPTCGSTMDPANGGCPQCGAANPVANPQQPVQGQQPVASTRESAPTRSRLLRQLQELQDQYGEDTSDTVHEFDDGWKVNRLKTYADKVREGEMMNNCFKKPGPMAMSELWAKHPDLGFPPEELEQAQRGMITDRFLSLADEAEQRGEPGQLVPSEIDLTRELPEDVFSLRDPDGIPKVNYHNGEAKGNANSEVSPEYQQYLEQWLQARESSIKTADSQGPRNDEQKAAVAEVLQEQGRGDEIPDMLLSPWNYSEELSQIQQKDTPPDPVDPSAATGVAGGPPGGGMGGPPGMGAPPGMGGMGGPPPGMGGMGGPPPGMGGMGGPPPGMGGPPMGPPGMGGRPGGPPGGNPGMGGPSMQPKSKVAEVEHPNVSVQPAADKVRRREVDKERDVAKTWVDEDQSPLKVGREYEMRSPAYDIPDIVRIVAIKPESVEFEIVSEFGLQHKTELTIQDAAMEGISFSEFESNETPDDEFPDEQNAERNDSTSGDQRDLANVHITAGKNDFNKEAGAKFAPLQQKEFIDERGTARNADKLDLSNTHYLSSDQSGESDDFLWL
jgi:hypothetical protein